MGQEAEKRVIFAGTPDFAVSCLETLFTGPEQVVAVFTQPDRRAGRGRALQESPVKRRAKEEEQRTGQTIPIFQPKTLKDPEIQGQMADLRPDLMVVVAFGMLLPKTVLDLPMHGAINVHASLLPKHRGAAPIQRAIQSGDVRSGVCVMQMDEGLDTGPVILCKEIDLSPEETGGSLHDKLMVLGASALRDGLNQIWAGLAQLHAQESEQASYAKKLRKDEAEIDWQIPAEQILRNIRAFNPYPVVHTPFRGKTMRIWRAEPGASRGEPGQILAVRSDGVEVAAGKGSVVLKEVQMPGKAIFTIEDFINGYQPEIGERLS